MDKRVTKDIIISVGVGYLLYSISLLSFLIAFPILMLNKKYKTKEVAISASLLLLLIAGTSLFRIWGAEFTKVTLCNFLLGLFIPFSLITSAVIWVKTKGEAVINRFVKSLLPACVSFIGFVIWFSLDSTLLNQVIDSFNKIFSSMWGDLLTDLGLEAEVFTNLLLMTVQSVLLPLTVALIGCINFVATASIRVADPEFDEQVSSFAVGEKAIWPLLISWSLVILGRFIPYPFALSLIVVNAAVITTFVYTFVGYCIVFYYHKKNKPYAKAINMFFLFVGLIMLLPGMNIALVFILSILGILETWFTIRK